jgi:hypothetical protein
MVQIIKWLSMFIMAIVMTLQNAYSLVGPVRMLPSGNVLLVPCEDIKLTEEHLDLYHHPLGIWLVEYRVRLENIRSQEITRPVGFPSGFEMRMIEGDLYCDCFENFQVFINDQELNQINFMTKCSNYVETTGTEWSMDDGSGIGFLNTWSLNFRPEEAKWITVSFSFIVKKAPPIYNPDIKESWYVDLVNWVKQDYSKRDENQFQLPLNIGSFWAFYPDSIVIRSYVANEWLKVIDKSERLYEKEFITRSEFSEPVGFYSPSEVILDSLSVDQLQQMSPTKLILLRNSFFAKYGRKFKTPILKKYFNAQPWYTENPDYNNWYLTQWDINNIKRIHEYEKSLK